MTKQQPKVEVGSRHEGHTVRQGNKDRKRDVLAYHHEHKHDNRNTYSSSYADLLYGRD